MTHARSPHAYPLAYREPSNRLLHAREDHARCLDLAASYRVRLSRGEREAHALHAWALGHARALRLRFTARIAGECL